MPELYPLPLHVVDAAVIIGQRGRDWLSNAGLDIRQGLTVPISSTFVTLMVRAFVPGETLLVGRHHRHLVGVVLVGVRRHLEVRETSLNLSSYIRSSAVASSVSSSVSSNSVRVITAQS